MNRFDIRKVRDDLNVLRGLYPELLDDEELWIDTLEGETDFNGVLSRILDEVSGSEELLAGIKARKAQIADRQKRIEERIEKLRGLIDSLMEQADVAKVELPEATISRRRVPPAVVVTDEDAIPRIYGHEAWKLDKKKLKEALEEGFEIAGAYLSNGGQSISIRRS